MNRIARYSSGNKECSFASFSPQNLSLLVGGSDGVTKILYANDHGRIVDTYQLKDHEGSVNHGEFSPNGCSMVTCSSDKTFTLYSVASILSVVGKFQHHQYGVRGCSFSSDNAMVCTAGWDSLAILSCSSTGQLLCTLRGHHKPLTVCKFSQQGMLVTGSWDKTIRVWDTQYKRSLPLTGHTDVIWSVSFDPAQPHVISSVSRDRTLSVWDIRLGGRVRLIKDDMNELVYISYSNDGKLLHCVGENSTYISRDTSNLQRVLYRSTSGHIGRINHCSVSNTGRMLATAGEDGYISLWDIDPSSRSEVDALAAELGMATVMDC